MCLVFNQALFGPAMAARIARFFHEIRNGEASLGKGKKLLEEEGEFEELSEREREVLELIAAGYNNTEIAQKLVISPKTVRNHITNIFSKLQVANRAQAIRRARSEGIG